MDKKIWLIINSYDDRPADLEPAFLHEATARQRADQLSGRGDGDYTVEWMQLDESEPSGEEHG